MIERLLSRLGGPIETNASSPAVGRFVILAVPRVGSNYLCSLLNSHPAILCHHELFHPKGMFYAFGYKDGRLDLGTIEERDRSPRDFIRKVWQGNFGCTCVGFKLLAGHNRRAFDLMLKDRDVKKLILVRRNRIRTYVSHLRAMRTGIYTVGDDTEQPAQVQLAVDVKALRRHARQNAAYYARLRGRLSRTEQPYLEVAYEDLATEEVRLRLLSYLGAALNPSVMQPQTKKQSWGSMRSQVANFKDLERSIRGTELESDLYT